MSRALRIMALCIAVSSLAGWATLGSNRGWTKTTVTRWQKDPVTEIDGPVVEKKFVPGIDLLAVGLMGAMGLFIVSLFAQKTGSNRTTSSS